MRIAEVSEKEKRREEKRERERERERRKRGMRHTRRVMMPHN